MLLPPLPFLCSRELQTASLGVVRSRNQIRHLAHLAMAAAPCSVPPAKTMRVAGRRVRGPSIRRRACGGEETAYRTRACGGEEAA
nr:unnamed protein product [Digitaria exilis]